MLYFRRIKMLGALLLGVLFFGPLAPASRATFELRYSTNGGSSFTTVVDNGVGDLSTSLGSIQVTIAGVGTVKVNSSATESHDATITLLDLSVNGSGIKGAINLFVQASINGLDTAPPPQTLDYNFTGSISGNALGVTQKFQTWVNNNNTLFGTAGIVANTTALTVPASGSIEFTAGTPYSMTTSIHVKTTGSKNSNKAVYSISNDSNNEIDPSPVPEPATMVLALIGGPVLGMGAWLRRRRILTAP
jgi:hypothetical protein